MDRRSVLRTFVTSALAGMGAALAAVFGRFAFVQGATAEPQWRRAAALGDLEPGIPYPSIVGVARQDGWSRTGTGETVFLVWDGLANVRAMSGTCTHLGCRVRWDGRAGRFKCPCHGGEYDASGRVTAGPPPQRLRILQARISDAGDVEVTL